MIPPSFSGEESCHGRFIIESLNIVFDLFKAKITDVISKTFIKPKVIPPFHGNKVTEPMVSQLM